MKNSLPHDAPWWAEFLTLFRMSKGIICLQPPYINFVRYYEKSLNIGSVMKFRKSLRISKFIIFIQPSRINFLKYYDKLTTVGSAMIRRFRTLFRMSKFIMFMQPPSINFLRYYKKIIYVWEGHDEQNSDHFSEYRSLLFLYSCHIIIF